MRFSCSINYLFTELPFLDRFAAASDAGFAGVEIQILPDIDVDEIGRAARDARVAIALLNLDMGDLFDGGPGLSGVPGREDAFADAIERAVEKAARLEIHHLHVGPSRIPEGTGRDACERVYRANLAALLARTRKVSPTTRIVIEAMNSIDMPDALVLSPDHIADLLDSHSGDVGILFDIYHIAMNGEDVNACFSRHRNRVAHVQYSNIPGRHEPGAGILDIHSFINAFDRLGFEGWFGAEYHPTKKTTSTLGWLAHHQELFPPRGPTSLLPTTG